MAWISQNWYWIAFAVGIFLWMRSRRGSRLTAGHHHAEDNAGPMAGTVIGLKDPVSGEPVNPDSAPNSTYAGRLYYFASRENLEKFETSPAQYAATATGVDGGHRHHRHGC